MTRGQPGHGLAHREPVAQPLQPDVHGRPAHPVGQGLLEMDGPGVGRAEPDRGQQQRPAPPPTAPAGFGSPPLPPRSGPRPAGRSRLPGPVPAGAASSRHSSRQLPRSRTGSAEAAALPVDEHDLGRAGLHRVGRPRVAVHQAARQLPTCSRTASTVSRNVGTSPPSRVAPGPATRSSRASVTGIASSGYHMAGPRPVPPPPGQAERVQPAKRGAQHAQLAVPTAAAPRPRRSWWPG